MELMNRAYDHADAVKLTAEVQQEYVARYGSPDETPTDPAEFAAPGGVFLIGYVDGSPVACGGWRAREAGEPGLRDGDAEIKRMYVVAGMRGRGYARRVLAELERTAAEAGRRRAVLETGVMQPEAISLYSASGYGEIPKFGIYSCSDTSRCYGKDLEG